MKSIFDQSGRSLFRQMIFYWDQFWFAKEGFINLAWMRIFLCGTMLYTYLWRTANLDYYSSASMLPREFSLRIFTEFARPHFSWCWWPDSWVLWIHTLYLVLLFLIVLGIANRPLMFFAWTLHMGFIHRNYSVLFGADVISGIFLFYLSFTQCCERLSLWSKLFPKGLFFKKSATKTDILSSAFYRLLQFQITAIYAYTGFEKLKGGTWWDGTALWTVVANPQMAAFNLRWAHHLSLFILVGSFVTILFEIYFPVMVWNPKTRIYWLGLGCVFHVMIGAMMGLMTFSLVMISTYFLFLPSRLLKTGPLNC